MLNCVSKKTQIYGRSDHRKILMTFLTPCRWNMPVRHLMLPNLINKNRIILENRTSRKDYKKNEMITSCWNDPLNTNLKMVVQDLANECL